MTVEANDSALDAAGLVSRLDATGCRAAFGRNNQVWIEHESAQDAEGRLAVRGPAYIDDLAIPRLAPSASIMDDMSRTMCVTHGIFLEFGFEVN